jgi:hypothetical protein
MQNELMTPAAILFGSVIIAAGLYFGLQRSAPPPAAPRAAALEDAPSQPAAPPPAPRPAPVQPAALAHLRRRVESDAARALEAKRAELVEQCWAPSFRKNPKPPRAKYLLSMSFDESGREIARGISEVRGMDRPDTGQCLRMIPLGIDVPAPGVNLAVDVELILP